MRYLEKPNDLIGKSHFRVVGVIDLRKFDHDGKNWILCRHRHTENVNISGKQLTKFHNLHII